MADVTSLPDPPRAHTEDECREKFLAHIRALVSYWATLPTGGDVHRRCEGVAFSILVMLDGGTMDLPKFTVMPDPHPEDRLFYSGKGENWWPDDVDIAGALHEHLHKQPVTASDDTGVSPGSETDLG